MFNSKLRLRSETILGGISMFQNPHCKGQIMLLEKSLIRIILSGLLIMGMLLFPVSASANGLCDTPITSNLTLTANLHCPNGDGLVIGADGITVDLGGFTVSGGSVVGTAGIRVHGFQDVIVMNGTVRDFDIGVVMETNTDTSRIASAMVSNIHATGNLSYGFLTTSEPGILPSTSTLINNIASDNGAAGIYFDKGTFTASRNNAYNNGREGIVAHGSSGTLDRDHAFNNALSGVSVSDVDDGGTIHHGVLEAKGVHSLHNGHAGFEIGGGADAMLVGNRALHNGGPGYACSSANSTSGNGNLAVGNAGGSTDGACSFLTIP
jgi:parallel beta-helix repeat protein